MNERYYGVPEICELLKLSKQTVWRYIRQGKLDAVKVGRQYFIPEASIVNLLEHGTAPKK